MHTARLRSEPSEFCHSGSSHGRIPMGDDYGDWRPQSAKYAIASGVSARAVR
jgi:hypothetical protein